MCGIVGILAAPGFKADRDVVEAMLAQVDHRGPDAVGFHLDGLADGNFFRWGPGFARFVFVLLD